MTESSSESLTMNMKPRLNMQVAASLRGKCVFKCHVQTEGAVGPHVTPDRSPGRKRVPAGF